MATESIKERILSHCETSLAAINGQGSYHHALATTARSQSPPSNLDAMPAAHLIEGEEAAIEGPYPLTTRTLDLTVRGWASVSDDQPDLTLATLLTRLAADIERAVLVDPTRGGLATNTTYAGSVPHEDEDPDRTGSVSVLFSILYQTSRTDPAALG